MNIQIWFSIGKLQSIEFCMGILVRGGVVVVVEEEEREINK